MVWLTHWKFLKVMIRKAMAWRPKSFLKIKLLL